MPIEIEVYAPIVTETSKAVIEKEMFWYDPFYSKMVSIRGSSLKYVYVDEEYIDLDNGTRVPISEATRDQLEEYKVKKAKRIKAMPTIFSIKVDTKKKDKEAVNKWFDLYTNYNHTKAEIVSSDSGSVIFDVPKNEVGDFSYSLDRKGIKFRIL